MPPASRNKKSDHDSPRFLVVAKVLRPHGIRGELAVQALTDYPERFRDLGTVYLGEFYVSQYSRQLLMLHVDLGCSTEGCFGVGGGGGNGTPWP